MDHDSQRQSAVEEARKLLTANPDLIFEDSMVMELSGGDIDFMLKFSSEWGGTLYLLDEMNKKRYENGLLEQEEYEYARRSYRLGLITLSTLYDKLKAWTEGEDSSQPYIYAMNLLDCFFVPGYMLDYCMVHPADKETGERLVQMMKARLSSGSAIEEAVSAIEAMVGEYIRHIHVYANSTKRPEA